MGAKTKFLKQFFKDRLMVGAVAPSTGFLAEKMLENIDFDSDDVSALDEPGIIQDDIIEDDELLSGLDDKGD